VAPVAETANLTRRASLNAAQSLLDYTARLAVGLIVTPILVRGLGQVLFGVWQVLGQLLGYLSATDGRPTDALRLVIANRAAVDDDETKRRYVGSAFVVWLLFLPLALIAGGALVWLAPALTKVAPGLVGSVRIAAALLLFQFLLATLSAVPEAVLKGANMGYKRMGLQATLQIVGGALSVAALALGLGLVGLSLGQVVLAAVTALCFWLLVRRYVPWFGVARPRRAEVVGLVRTSAWLAVGDLIAKLLVASDVVILSLVLGPAAATPYVLTAYASRTAMGILVLGTLGAMPGLGRVIGQGRHEQAAALRKELLWITWLAATALGTAMLVWNRAFVSLWVGSQQYAGVLANLLLVVAVVQTAFIRCDSYIIDATLKPRQRVVVGAVAAVTTIAASLVLTRFYGITGLCLGIILGRLVQSVAYPVLAARAFGEAGWAGGVTALRSLVRPTLAMAALFALAAFVGERELAGSWVLWGLGVLVTGILGAALAYVLGLPAAARIAATRRVREALGGLGA